MATRARGRLHEGRVIDRGDIHYREYAAWIVADPMKEVGYRIDLVEPYRAGIAPTHTLPLGYIIEARKP